MMADASEIDAALANMLAADATLMTLCPDGVYMDLAPAGKKQFVVVSLILHVDQWMEGPVDAFHRAQYLVKAVDLDTSGQTVKAAAARIHALLTDTPLAIAGYSHMLTRREERIRYTQPDPDEPELHWQHRGGRYVVFASPLA